VKADRDAEDFFGDKAWPPDTDALVVQLYPELRQIAHRENFRAGQPMTLQTTAIINESWLKLRPHAAWQSRSHFLGCAATAMRHILIDGARARLAAKRQVDQVPTSAAEDSELVRLGDALRDLAAFDPSLAQIVECRFFAGYDEAETAQILGISDRTVPTCHLPTDPGHSPHATRRSVDVSKQCWRRSTKPACSTGATRSA